MPWGDVERTGLGASSKAGRALVLDAGRLPSSLLRSLDLVGISTVEVNSFTAVSERIQDARPDILLCPDKVLGRNFQELIAKLSDQRAAETLPLVLFAEVPSVELGFADSVAEVLTQEDGMEEAGMLIRAALRRKRPQVLTEVANFGALSFDPLRYNLVYGEKIARLRKLDLCVLGAMFDDPERVWSRKLLSRMIFPPGKTREGRNTDAYLSRVRRHIRQEIDLDVIRAVRGKGYALHWY